jgi:hypothetical protein
LKPGQPIMYKELRPVISRKWPAIGICSFLSAWRSCNIATYRFSTRYSSATFGLFELVQVVALSIVMELQIPPWHYWNAYFIDHWYETLITSAASTWFHGSYRRWKLVLGHYRQNRWEYQMYIYN